MRALTSSRSALDSLSSFTSQAVICDMKRHKRGRNLSRKRHYSHVYRTLEAVTRPSLDGKHQPNAYWNPSSCEWSHAIGRGLILSQCRVFCSLSALYANRTIATWMSAQAIVATPSGLMSPVEAWKKTRIRQAERIAIVAIPIAIR